MKGRASANELDDLRAALADETRFVEHRDGATIAGRLAWARIIRFVALDALGRPAEALEEWKLCAEVRVVPPLSEDFLEFHLYRARFLLELQRDEEARSLLDERAAVERPELAARCRRGISEIDSGIRDDKHRSSVADLLAHW